MLRVLVAGGRCTSERHWGRERASSSACRWRRGCSLACKCWSRRSHARLPIRHRQSRHGNGRGSRRGKLSLCSRSPLYAFFRGMPNRVSAAGRRSSSDRRLQDWQSQQHINGARCAAGEERWSPDGHLEANRCHARRLTVHGFALLDCICAVDRYCLYSPLCSAHHYARLAHQISETRGSLRGTTLLLFYSRAVESALLCATSTAHFLNMCMSCPADQQNDLLNVTSSIHSESMPSCNKCMLPSL